MLSPSNGITYQLIRTTLRILRGSTVERGKETESCDQVHKQCIILSTTSLGMTLFLFLFLNGISLGMIIDHLPGFKEKPCDWQSLLHRLSRKPFYPSSLYCKAGLVPIATSREFSESKSGFWSSHPIRSLRRLGIALEGIDLFSHMRFHPNSFSTKNLLRTSSFLPTNIAMVNERMGILVSHVSVYLKPPALPL